MKNQNCTTLALALVALALAATQTRAENLVVNGSFEVPAHPGNGDIYQTDPGFTLPGWSVSGSASNVFVEYGVHVIDQLPPLVQTRYADGRQALCLNDYGLGGAHINRLVPSCKPPSRTPSLHRSNSTTSSRRRHSERPPEFTGAMKNQLTGANGENRESKPPRAPFPLFSPVQIPASSLQHKITLYENQNLPRISRLALRPWAGAALNP